jgi:hypothetical protein
MMPRTAALVPLCLALALPLGAACRPPASGKPRPPGAPADTAADSGAGGADSGDTATAPPPGVTLDAVEPFPGCGSCAVVRATTSRAARARLVHTGPDGDRWASPWSAVGTAHTLVARGLLAEQTTLLQVEAEADGARGRSEEAPVAGEPLPADLPPITVTVHDEGRATPGWVFFSINRWTSLPDPTWAYLLAVDRRGRVAWVQKAPLPTLDYDRLPEGGSLFTAGLRAVLQTSLGGTVERIVTTTDAGADTFHHEVLPLADDSLAVLSTELRTISGYPDGAGGTRSHNVVGDVLLHLDWDGTVRARHPLLDLLDPLSVHAGFDSPFWAIPPYDEVEDAKDWSHSNTIVEHPDNADWVLSVRNHSQLVRIGRDSGQLVWKLGAGGDFTLTSGTWFSHQHLPVFLPSGNLLVYDNGNAATDDAPDRASGAVEYAVDESARTVREVWRYARGGHAPVVGSAQRLPNGHTLINDGGLVDAPTLPELDPGHHRWVRFVEVTGGPSPEVVWELVIDDRETPSINGHTVYRAAFADSLYGVPVDPP